MANEQRCSGCAYCAMRNVLCEKCPACTPAAGVRVAQADLAAAEAGMNDAASNDVAQAWAAKGASASMRLYSLSTPPEQP